jgi:hypothetical protein
LPDLTRSHRTAAKDSAILTEQQFISRYPGIVTAAPILLSRPLLLQQIQYGNISKTTRLEDESFFSSAE